MGLFSRRKAQQSQSVEVEEGWPVDSPNGFIVFDIETTGLSPLTDRILEIGMVRVDSSGKPLGYWSSLVNPQGPVGATHIHGIKESDVSNSPTFNDLVEELLPKLRGQVLVAHNAKFDHSFLRTELGRLGWSLPDVPVVCTMIESRIFLPGLDSRRLVDCAQAIGINQEVEHRALGDASLTTSILNFFLNGPVDRKRAAQLQQLPIQASAVSWPTRPGTPITPDSAKRYSPRKSAPSRLELLKTVSEVMPEDLLGDSPSVSELSYANLLLQTLEDGLISDAELAALSDCASAFNLDSEGQSKIHLALTLALAREAWRDGVVSRAEQQQILECAKRFGLDDSMARGCIREIEDLRAARVAARSKSLPESWEHGDPLRVGDRIVITGCYEFGREMLEDRARKNGLKVTGSVSGKTTLLVSDGSVGGNKDSDAKRLGVRIVRPEVFKELLDFIQPSKSETALPDSTGSQNLPGEDQLNRTESLVCISCGGTFIRVISRGRKPHECENCRTSGAGPN